MRKAILLGAVLLVTPSVADAQALPVNLPDEAMLRVTVETRTQEAGRDPEPVIVAYDVRLSRNRDGERLAYWSVAEINGNSPEFWPEAYRGPLAYEMIVDEGLLPLRVENLPHIVASSLPPGEADSEGGRQLREWLEGLTPETAVFELVGPIRAANHIALGQQTELVMDQPLVTREQETHQFGGRPVEVETTYALLRHDPVAGRAEVLWTSGFEPQSFPVPTEAAADLIAALPGPRWEQALDEIVAERRDRCHYHIDIPTGLALLTECAFAFEAVVAGQRVRREEQVRITQALLPAES